MKDARAVLAGRVSLLTSTKNSRFAKGWLRVLAYCVVLGSAEVAALAVLMAGMAVTASASPAQTAQACRELQNFNQPESRDTNGRINVEAALIHVVNCNGRQFYIYQYLKRPGFRAILPPDYAHAIGGRDFATYAEALAAAFAASNGGNAAAPAAPGQPQAPGAGGGPAKAIGWMDYPLTATRGYDKNGQRFTYTCPPNGAPFRITGTDFYLDDTSICTAAVQVGLITFARGGTVTVQVERPGPTKYVGSTRNGVTSNSYDNGTNPTLGAFVFVK
jgi:LCCL domain